MKKYFLSLVLCILGSSFHLNAKECSSVSFEFGLYDYSVDDACGGCCSGKATKKAYLTTYFYSEGAWEVSEITDITGDTAQKACCHNS